jgi:hypothetical protein
MGPNVDLASLPAGVLVALVVLVLAELALDAIALISLAKRPREAVLFGNKWVWVAIILVINPLGAIVYLAVGRTAAAPVEHIIPSARFNTSTTSIADALYGERNPKDDG